MSKQDYVERNRSVSDGDLTCVDKKKAKAAAFSLENNDKQTFFTVPRWMSVRRKKNKIKYVKVDVPYNAHDDTDKCKYNSLDSKKVRREKNPEKSTNFIHLARGNKAHSKRYGTRGEVTQQLGSLLKSLWSCQYNANISNKFKQSVAKYGPQYEGSEQHDAQEFLLWLMDKVHEDINVASKEKYKKTKKNLGRSDEDIAAEMLANHLRCNISFIHAIFQGQFKSSLCCLGCGRFSNTFDPYLCVSLPIPSFQNIPVFLYIVFLNEKININHVGMLLDSQATVYDLQENLNSTFKTSKDSLLLLEIIDGEYQRTFYDSDSVEDFKDSKHLYALETPPRNKNTGMEGERISLVVINKIPNGNKFKMLWRPFVLDVPREISYVELQEKIFTAMSYPFYNILNLDLKDYFSLCVIDGERFNEAICSSVDMPLYMPAIDKALLLSSGQTPHVKLSVIWNKVAKDIFSTESNFIEEHSSVEDVVNFKKQSGHISLNECFDLYFNEERLESEDAWVCAYCHHRLPCVKSLSLWTVPDVFIVHLKRFRQSSYHRAKITTFVDFPFTGLDMNPYIKRNQHNQQMNNNSMPFWSPWKRPRSRSSRFEDNVYELYAVCNHYGSMLSGHYTAYCRNPVNGHWYHYDDTKVQEVQASEVLSADAYILFYQRSTLNSHSCASSSSSGYSSASSAYSIPEHWAFHMASFFPDVPLTSKSQDNLYDAGKTASLDRRSISSHRPFDRSAKEYMTLYPPPVDKLNASKFDVTDSSINNHEKKSISNEIPPPPPPSKHYWTVTSV
ncbi:ubiquitin carboxyl-terminal hydrolase 31 [Caerostris extrusa]|uniref:ubiquitinyl hydrolase 1 n=1 Tax=Caerostris extrusa TaxID=172846 RepID=A0AAV4RJ61_CAEEX|nr:ubiquitin carboxyl-terminal hydrolase 31 [Caerostris extrusa]